MPLVRPLVLCCLLTLFGTLSATLHGAEGPTSEMKTLAKALSSAKLSSRLEALDTLRKMGPDATPIASEVVRLGVMSRDTKTRDAALDAFEKIRPDLHKPLIDIVVDQSASVRRTAIDHLGELGEKSRCTMPLLRAMFEREVQDPDGDWLHLLAAVVHVDGNDPWVVKLVLGLVSNPTPRTANNSDPYQRGRVARAKAISLLPDIKVEDKQRIRALITGLANPDNRILTINALAGYGTEASDAISSLNRLKLDKDAEVRDAVSAALLKIKP